VPFYEQKTLPGQAVDIGLGLAMPMAPGSTPAKARKVSKALQEAVKAIEAKAAKAAPPAGIGHNNPPSPIEEISELTRQYEAGEGPARWLGKAPDRTTSSLIRPQGRGGQTSARLQRFLQKAQSDPAIFNELRDLIEGGGEGGLNWYNSEAMRDMFVAAHGGDEVAGDKAWRDITQWIAGTSTGAKVPKNIDITLDMLPKTRPQPGLSAEQEREVANRIADELEAGLIRPGAGAGHKMQSNHIANIASILRGDWSPIGPREINLKPRGFGESMRGSEGMAAVDTHATRTVAMLAKDPDWLISSGEVGGEWAADIMKRYPKTRPFFKQTTDKTGATHMMFKPKAAVAAKAVPFDRISDYALVYEAQPNENEYGVIEKMIRDLGAETGRTAAQAQAGYWIGNAAATGVDPTSIDPLVKIFINRVRAASERTGVPPSEIIASLATTGQTRQPGAGLGSVQMPHEQVPFGGSGHLTGTELDKPGAKEKFTSARTWKSGPGGDQGKDVLSLAAGLPTLKTQPGTGLWRPKGGGVEVSPVETAGSMVPLTTDANGPTIDPTALNKIQQLQSVRGMVDVQGGEAYFRLFTGADPSVSSSILIPLNRPLTRDEMIKLTAVTDKYGIGATADTGRGVDLMRFDEGADADSSEALLNQGMGPEIRQVLPDLAGARIAPVRQVGGYVDLENAWQQPPGSGAVSREVAGVLQPDTAAALDASPEVKTKLLQKNAADIADAQRTGRPLRQDVIALRQYLHDHGFVAFLDRVAKTGGVGLPAAALGVLLGEDALRDDRPPTGSGS
jgi:hypothetical protein